MEQEYKIPKTIVFGMVHSHKLVVVLLHKHFTSTHSTAFNSISIITNCGAHSGAVYSDCATCRLRVEFQVVSLKLFIDNLVGRTMTLGSTQPLKEIITRNIWGGVTVVQYRECCTFTFITNCAYATMSKSNI